jgi:adenine-specific DNA-methyltransferase
MKAQQLNIIQYLLVNFKYKNRNCIKFRFNIINLLIIMSEMENILSLNYIGSKKTLISTLDKVLSKYLNKNSIFGDLCSGTGFVSQFVKYKYKCSVVSNDLQEYSKIITEAKLNSYDTKEIKIISDCFQHLNNKKLIKGFFYENYRDKYFTSNNCKKIDTIRQEIDQLKITNKIKTYILASLISTADKKANCAGVYGAYLKSIKKSAQGDIILTELPIINKNESEIESKHISYTGDLFDKQITDIKYSTIYIDPPYNNRQYGSNYHILETMAKYDNPEIKGKTGLRPYDKSDFCYKNKIKSMFEKLKKLKFETLIISYSSEGLMNIFDIIEIFIETYKVIIYEKEYKKFKSQKTQKNDTLTEYIIVIENKENVDKIFEFVQL